MQDGSCQIEYRFKARRKAFREATLYASYQGRLLQLLCSEAAVPQLGTQRLQHLAHCIGHARATKFSLQALQDGVLKQFIYRR